LPFEDQHARDQKPDADDKRSAGNGEDCYVNPISVVASAKHGIVSILVDSQAHLQCEERKVAQEKCGKDKRDGGK
jgi:hypothetical protein